MDYGSIADFTDEILQRKDPYNHHGSKVSELCMKMAALLDVPLNDHELAMLNYGSRLHDVGKIFIEDGILNAHGRLTENQSAIIRTHTTQGFHLSLALKFDPIICRIVRNHHENMDGTGYPDGLVDNSIPFFARMVRVADTFDAMTSPRAYRKAESPSAAMMLIEAESERVFDPYLVKLLKRVVTENDPP